VLLVVVALLVVLFVITWTARRHGESATVQPGWRPTDERFVDPSTGRRMQVFVDDQGTRHYVPDSSPGT
jgi:hypothetical protein